MIRIVTDTAADITFAQGREMGIEIVPLQIQFPGAQYDATQDEDFSRFYEMLVTEKAFPKTSQPTPEAFAQVFQAAKDAGDSVVAILISGGLSGTVQSAQIAKDLTGADVQIVDSRAAIMPQRILVEQAVRLRDAGESSASIVDKVTALMGRVKVFGMIDTLTYLYKGGRLSRTVAIAGNLLRLRPVVTLRDGKIALVGRGRNQAALISRLDETGFDPAFPVYFGYTANPANCDKLMQQTLELHPEIEDTGKFSIGGLIGAHVGPNAMAIAFVTPQA